MKNENKILSQDECLKLIFNSVNNKIKGYSFIRKNDGENIMLAYGVNDSITFYNYRKKLVHFNIAIWDISFQLYIRSELIKAFSNATILGIGGPEYKHGLWAMEDDILSYYSFLNPVKGDMNFHMGFIKIPNKNKLVNPIAQKIISNRKIGIVGNFNVEKFLHKFGSKVINKIEIPKRRAKFQQMNRKKYNIVLEKIYNYNSDVDFWLVAAGIYAKSFCEYIRQNGGIGIDIGSSLDTWANEYHSRGHLRRLFTEYKKNK